MKVMILANSSKGLYGFRNELVIRLLEKYEVLVSIPDDICAKELEDEGCKVIHTDINRRGMNPIEDIKLYKEYVSLIKAEKPDLVLAYTIKPNIYGGLACRKCKVPYMSTITGLGSVFNKEGLLKNVIVQMYRKALKKAECVFFQNSDNMDVFEKNGIKGKSQKLVSGSGVNLDIHKYADYPETEKIKFLFIGRILREKGIFELLEAAKALKNENISFEILGDCDEDYVDLLKDNQNKGYIVWHGFQKDVTSYLKSCSALVLPTFYPEGMSNVLMEASATGRPVLGTNIPGSREVIEDGVTGYIFEPRDAQSLIEAINKFLSLSFEERKEMGIAARKKMEQDFDRKKVVNDYMTEIDKILKG